MYVCIYVYSTTEREKGEIQVKHGVNQSQVLYVGATQMFALLILVCDSFLVSQADEAWKAAYSKPGRKLLVEKYKKTEVKGHIQKRGVHKLTSTFTVLCTHKIRTIRTNTNRVRYTRDHSRVIRVTGRFGRVRRQRERGTPVKEQESPSRDLTLAPHFPALLCPLRPSVSISTIERQGYSACQGQ